MALQLNYCVPQDCDCKSVSFSDTTGVYDATTNPTGYGGINPLTSNIISSTITFFSPNETQGIVFAFTILNNDSPVGARFVETRINVSVPVELIFILIPSPIEENISLSSPS